MNLDNWTQPFELAFKLALFSVGWILVLLVSSLVIAVSIAILKSIPSLFLKKKSEEPAPLYDAYNDAMSQLAKTKNLKVVKDDE